MSLLDACNVSIEFPGVKALNDVSFKIEEGQIVALCGENGAGKSTLAKIISGVYPFNRYDGTVNFDHKPIRFSSTRDAEKNGIAIVHQELNLIHEMTVAENIFLDTMPNKMGVVDFKALNQQAALFLNEVGLDVDPAEKIKNLTVSKKQMVEIAKAIAKKPRVLIFDEATSSLANKEIETLFKIMRALKKQKTTMLYVSHKLDEIFQVCDELIVLKDGAFIRQAHIRDITKDDIIKWMVGRNLTEMFPPRAAIANAGEEVMRVEDWSVADPKDSGKKVVDKISMSVNRQEIVGIYGLVGAGRTEFVESIFRGKRVRSSGAIYIKNKPVTIVDSSDAIRHGISLVTEDRKKSGLVLCLSVRDNIVLAALRKFMGFGGRIDEKSEEDAVTTQIKSLKIKVPDTRHLVRQLSGGNQQKVVLSKWLLTTPDLLILDEPTRGIDVGTKAEIYKILRDLANKGMAIIMVSSELPEILGISDRILTMCSGRVTANLPITEATEEKLVKYAMGGSINE